MGYLAFRWVHRWSHDMIQMLRIGRWSVAPRFEGRHRLVPGPLEASERAYHPFDPRQCTDEGCVCHVYDCYAMNMSISNSKVAQLVDKEKHRTTDGPMDRWGAERPNKAKWQEEMMKAFDRVGQLEPWVLEIMQSALHQLRLPMGDRMSLCKQVQDIFMCAADRVSTAEAGHAMLIVHKLSRRLGNLLSSSPFELMPHMANAPREALIQMWETSYDAYSTYFIERFCCEEKVNNDEEARYHMDFCGPHWDPGMWGGGEPDYDQQTGCKGYYECYPHPHTKWNAVSRSKMHPQHGSDAPEIEHDPTVISFDGGPLDQGDSVSSVSLEALCQLLASHAATETTILHLTPRVPVVAETWWHSPDTPCLDTPFLSQLLRPFIPSQIATALVGFVPVTNQSFRIGGFAVEAIDQFSQAESVNTLAIMLDQVPSVVAHFCACATKNRLRNVLISTAATDMPSAMHGVTEALLNEVGQNLENIVFLTSASSWVEPCSETCTKLVQASNFSAVNVSLHDRDFAHCLKYMDGNCHFSRCKCCALQASMSGILDKAYQKQRPELRYSLGNLSGHSLAQNTDQSLPCTLCSTPTNFNRLASELALLHCDEPRLTGPCTKCMHKRCDCVASKHVQGQNRAPTPLHWGNCYKKGYKKAPFSDPFAYFNQCAVINAGLSNSVTSLCTGTKTDISALQCMRLWQSSVLMLPNGEGDEFPAAGSVALDATIKRYRYGGVRAALRLTVLPNRSGFYRLRPNSHFPATPFISNIPFVDVEGLDGTILTADDQAALWSQAGPEYRVQSTSYGHVKDPKSPCQNLPWGAFMTAVVEKVVMSIVMSHRGRFKHEDDIDDEIKLLESQMTTAMTIAEARNTRKSMWELRVMRSHVKALEMVLQGI